MPHYRVTYVETVLRERFVDARSPDDATDTVRFELSEAQHHHVADSWDDDWQAEEADPKNAKTCCYECGAFALLPR